MSNGLSDVFLPVTTVTTVYQSWCLVKNLTSPPVTGGVQVAPYLHRLPASTRRSFRFRPGATGSRLKGMAAYVGLLPLDDDVGDATGVWVFTEERVVSGRALQAQSKIMKRTFF